LSKNSGLGTKLNPSLTKSSIVEEIKLVFRIRRPDFFSELPSVLCRRNRSIVPMPDIEKERTQFEHFMKMTGCVFDSPIYRDKPDVVAIKGGTNTE